MSTIPVPLNTIPTTRSNGTMSLYDNRTPAVAFYFSASWCGPCRQLTPVLAENYQPGKMEILFVSLDRDENEFKRYHQTMPWPAVSFQSEDLRNMLKAALKVSGIPALVTISSDGVVLNHNARNAFMRAPTKCPWPESAVQHLHESIEHRGGDINTSASAVLFVPTNAENNGATEIAAFESVAGQAPTDMPRFVAQQDKGGASDMVSMAMGYTTNETKCRLSVIDVQFSGGSFFPAGDIDLTDGNVIALFLADYRAQPVHSLSR
jgi:thiol-disulfide isomerase/thioredoxin